jgi:hypothetical protein
VAKKVKVLGALNIVNTVNSLFNDRRTKQRLLRESGGFVVQRNQRFARTGKSLKGNKTIYKLPFLKQFTLKRRKELFKTRPSELGEFFNPRRKRSNVTLTGQLVDSLSFKLDKGFIAITISGRRRKLEPDDANTNPELYEELEDISGRDFQFIGLDKTGQRVVKQKILNQLRAEIKKLFK